MNKIHISGGSAIKIVIKEQLDNLLFEQVYTPKQIYDKYYKDEFKKAFYPSHTDEELFELFEQIIKYDPTTQNDAELKPVHMGRYSKWILNQYLKRKVKKEDLYKVEMYLDTLHTKKDRMKADGRTIDITRIKDVNALYMEVATYMVDDEEEYLTNTQEIKKIKMEETQRFHEDENWLVVIPKTERSACLYGKGTQWCTAASKSNNMFDSYTKEEYPDTNLYIFISKKDPKVKYQMHLQSQQFMDVNDQEVSKDDMKEMIPMDLFFKVAKNESELGMWDVKKRGNAYYAEFSSLGDLSMFFHEDEVSYVLHGHYYFTDLEFDEKDYLKFLDKESMEQIKRYCDEYAVEGDTMAEKINNSSEIIDALHEAVTEALNPYVLEQWKKTIVELFEKTFGVKVKKLKSEYSYYKCEVTYSMLLRLTGYNDYEYDIKGLNFDNTDRIYPPDKFDAKEFNEEFRYNLNLRF